MCRDGFRAPCEECGRAVTCRDQPILCSYCHERLFEDDLPRRAHAKTMIGRTNG